MESPRPEQVPDVSDLAAVIRADAADLEVYARVLTTTLADALPAGMVEVERKRSMADRVAGRPGTVTLVRVLIGETGFELAASSGGPQARVLVRSGGVVISRRSLPVAAWADELAARLAELAKASGDARAALGRLLGL